jgi:5-methylcytosine-specific restriction protein A
MKLKTLKPRLGTILTQRVPTLTDQPNGWRTQGMTSAQRGYGYRWQKARERHLQAHPLCVMCQAEGRTAVATVVDHRDPHRGDQAVFWDESRWQSLCASHHSSEKQRQENEEARK